MGVLGGCEELAAREHVVGTRRASEVVRGRRIGEPVLLVQLCRRGDAVTVGPDISRCVEPPVVFGREFDGDGVRTERLQYGPHETGEGGFGVANADERDDTSEFGVRMRK